MARFIVVLRLAVNELTICGKVDSHYYSRTYGKCYWCDRSIKLGVDIFLGKVSSTALSIPASKPITNATIPANNKQKYHTIKLWNVSEIRTLQGDSQPIMSVTYSPDGNIFASGSNNGTIKLWNVATRAEISTLQGHSDLVISVAFSPDGKTLVSGSGDNTIKLWDVATGEEIRTLKGHSNYVYSVTFSPDGKTLASGSADDTIKLWNVASGEEILNLHGHFNSVTTVAFSADGKNLASAGGSIGYFKFSQRILAS